VRYNIQNTERPIVSKLAQLTAIKADHIFSLSTDFTAEIYLLLKDGIIEKISDSPPVYPGMRQLDFTGFTVSPFFCDYHLHFSGSSLATSQRISEALLPEGIHKVFEGGDSLLSGLEMKRLLKGRLEVRTAGYGIYKKGTYGKALGKGVEGLREARALMDQLRGLGVDYIKVINSGIYKPETGQITAGGFEKEELAGVMQYAKDHGLDVFCHANGAEKVYEAVSAGVSAIIHGLHISDATLDIMAQKKIAFIPTAQAFASLSSLTGDPEIQKNIARAVEGHLLTIKKAVDRGVRVLPGSDSGPHFIPYGKAYQKELELFKQAGLSDEYILSSAAIGQFKPGMQADFLVLKGIEIEKIFLCGEALQNQDGPE
jgi:imidazolonepropionase-like amidohydrolase